jgi:phosphopantetheinyl transferase
LHSVFSDAEWREINESQVPLRTFFNHWVLKESYIKAIGLGLAIDLNTLEFYRSPEVIQFLRNRQYQVSFNLAEVSLMIRNFYALTSSEPMEI